MTSQEAISGRMQLCSADNAGEDAQKRSTKRKNTSHAAKWIKIQRSVRARGIRWLGWEWGRFDGGRYMGRVLRSAVQPFNRETTCYTSAATPLNRDGICYAAAVPHANCYNNAAQPFDRGAICYTSAVPPLNRGEICYTYPTMAYHPYAIGYISAVPPCNPDSSCYTPAILTFNRGACDPSTQSRRYLPHFCGPAARSGC